MEMIRPRDDVTIVAMESSAAHYEYTIDAHQTRGEVRMHNGEWSAYVFVDPVADGAEPSPRAALAKALRYLAEEIESEDAASAAPAPKRAPRKR